MNKIIAIIDNHIENDIWTIFVKAITNKRNIINSFILKIYYKKKLKLNYLL